MAVVGEEGKASGSRRMAAHHRKRMDDALPTKHKPAEAGGKNELYNELWRACAGPLVYVPRVGDIVYYFLQGHMEQVEAYNSQDDKAEMPVYNLPPKILCEVVYAQLKAEPGTDEVFAQITLLPRPEIDELSLEVGNSPPLPPKLNVCSFSKKLTPSDTSTHGGFSVPKRHADECLPPLDMSKDPPLQELVAKDLHGLEWRIRHIYRGQPKRHLLTSGWSVFVTSKKLVAGDVCIFLRGGDGELRVGVRRAMKLQNNASTSVISSPSMQHGILAGAFHAISTGTRFTVYYHPWTSPAEFLVPFSQYMKSAEIDYSIGSRFRMVSEGEECADQRIAGTVVGTEDVDHIRWPASEWRCLKVKWDATTDSITRPARVSPWNIEPIERTHKRPASVQHQQKRLRPNDASSPWFSSLFSNGVFQGQENRVTGVKALGAAKTPLLPSLVRPPNPVWAQMQSGLENKLKFPMHDPIYMCLNRMVSLPGGSLMSPGLSNHWPASPFAPYEVCETAAQSKNLSVPNASSENSGSQMCMALELKDENRTPLAQPNGGSRYMLFGVNLVNSPPELPSPQMATSNELESPCSVPPTSQSSISETIQVSEPSKSVSGILPEKQCKNCCVSRSCTKVIKFGTALGRSVDLTRFHGYDELISELDQMFDFNGSLIDGNSGFHIAYMDDEGDMMLVGDNPWQDFQCAVRRMFICPKEDIDGVIPSSPNPTPPQ